jgi:hypothetical protein
MRPRLHRSSPAHQDAGAARLADTQGSSAEGLLGAGHPLVGLLRQAEVVYEEILAVTAVQAAGTVFLLGGHTFGWSVAVAALMVQLGLGWRLVLLRVSRRDVCVNLIAEGRGELRLTCVEKECRRLSDPGRARQHARSIDELLKAADHPPRASVSRPLFDVGVIRSVSPELRHVAGLMRENRPPLRGVAHVERLITGGSTPMYGTEVAPLREELRRAAYLLSVDR